MRSINYTYYTYMNNGSPFVFRVDKMTRHPHKAKGATMLQVHAILALEGIEDGQSTEILNSEGTALTKKQIEYAAQTGNVPPA